MATMNNARVPIPPEKTFDLKTAEKVKIYNTGAEKRYQTIPIFVSSNVENLCYTIMEFCNASQASLQFQSSKTETA